MASTAPIGIFDSGLGGLSVAREIAQLMPAESLCYIADSHFAPYGDKANTQILQRSKVCCEKLLDEGAKVIVVACNTATAAAVQQLRRCYTTPIIAMEPAIKPAAQLTRSGRIGVLATAGTLSSEKYEQLLSQHAADVQVFSQACRGLVEEIERGELDSIALRTLLKQYLTPLLQAKVDTLILGCTHYPLIRPLISELAGEGVEIVDSGEAVARRVQQQLIEHQLLSHRSQSGPWHCWSSGALEKQKRLIQQLLNRPFELNSL